MPKDYYVYHLGPTPANPRWRYAFYATTLKSEDLPDIRYYQPIWIYNEGTRKYTPVESKQLWVRK